MRLSHGNISRVLEYLSALRQCRMASLRDFSIVSCCTRGERLWIERFCEMCRLTRLSNDASDELTDAGMRVADGYLASHSISETFRILLAAYVVNARPGWANRMPAGRAETFSALSADEYYCFQQAGLAGNFVDDSLVEWWDSAAESFRSVTESRALETGRMGERLTIRHERMRTGRDPEWEAIESNFLGYDILSSEDAQDDSPRLIEVKTSEKPIESASFFVSRNEWETAMASSAHYYFYLWALGPKPMLAIIRVEEMEQHMALNRGSGSWCSVEIPYSAFIARFSSASTVDSIAAIQSVARSLSSAHEREFVPSG